MRLEKIEEGEEITHYEFFDYIDCGEHYLLTGWRNETKATVILNQNTNLEDLHERHRGSIGYSKLCRTTFRPYETDNPDIFVSSNLDRALSRGNITTYLDWWPTRILKALITGEGLEELRTAPCIVRWPKEGSSRGEDWYRLLKD